MKQTFLALLAPLMATAAVAQNSCITTAKVKTVPEEYSRIAQATGGQVFNLQPDEISQMDLLGDKLFFSKLVSVTEGRAEVATIAQFDKPLVEPKEIFAFSVDPLSTGLYISISVFGPAKINLIEPKGILRVHNNSTTTVKQTSGTCTIAITDSIPGTWNIEAEGQGLASIKAATNSKLQFERFKYVAPSQDIHAHYETLKEPPVIGSTSRAELTIFGEELLGPNPWMELRTFAGETLKTVPLKHYSEFYFLTEPFEVSAQPMRAVLIGKSKNGELIERVFSHSVEGAAVDPEDPTAVLPDGISTLYFAITMGNTERALELLQNKADPNLAAPDGSTPLMAAANQGNVSVVKALLDRGADVRPMTKYRGTALFRAVVAENPEIVKLLVEHGAPANIKDGSGYTAVDWAQKRNLQEILKLLKKAPVSDIYQPETVNQQ